MTSTRSLVPPALPPRAPSPTPNPTRLAVPSPPRRPSSTPPSIDSSSCPNPSRRDDLKKSWSQFRHLDEEAFYAEICLLSEPELVEKHAVMQRKMIAASSATGASIGASFVLGPAALLGAPVGLRRMNVNTRRVALIKKRLEEMCWAGYQTKKRDYVIPVVSNVVGAVVPAGANAYLGHAASGLVAHAGRKAVVSGVNMGLKTGARMGMQKVAYRKEAVSSVANVGVVITEVEGVQVAEYEVDGERQDSDSEEDEAEEKEGEEEEEDDEKNIKLLSEGDQ